MKSTMSNFIVSHRLSSDYGGIVETDARPLTTVAPWCRVWIVSKRGTENALDCWRHLDNCIASPWAGWSQHAREGAIFAIGHGR